MSSDCNHVAHRTIEGILTYLNAFLILDLARSTFKGNLLMGVVIMLIISIIVFYYLRKSCPNCSTSSTPVVMETGHIPPDPEELTMEQRRRALGL
jgi:hypothetical protein